MTLPVEFVERIDLDELGVDDVAIGELPGYMMRIERMSNGSFWSCLYMPTGDRHVFWFYAKKGKLTVEHRLEHDVVSPVDGQQDGTQDAISHRNGRAP